MAGFRRWYRRRYPQRYRRYFRRYRRYYRRRFVNGSSRSTVRLKVPVIQTFNVTRPANSHGTTFARFCPFHTWSAANTTPSALGSELYRIYCDLYDEVKCIGMKVKVNICNQVGGTDIPSLEIYTALDRRTGYGEPNVTFANVRKFSTFSMATAVNNSVAKIERSCYASDLMEKAQWHDCSLTLTKDGDGNVTAASDSAYVQAGANPNFFVPCFFLGFDVPTKTTEITINFTTEVMYYFSFRNPKYGGSSSAAKLSVDRLDGIRAVPDGDDDVDMGSIPPLPPDDDDDFPPVDEIMSQPQTVSAKRATSGTTIVTSKTRKRDASDRPRAPRLN